MSKKKKKHHHEEHVDESWLIPYADLLTLLLALFIVLFASSSVDAQKFQQMAESFSSAFNGGTGLMEYPSPLPEDQPQSLNEEDAQNKDNENPEFDKEEQNELRELQEQNELKELQEKINKYIDAKQLDTRLETTLTDEGLLITILNDVFFDSGVAEVKLNEESLVKDLSELLVSDPPRNVIISGHTDNVPISNSQFDSNWHLSVMRAVNFMKLLLDNESLDERRFSAKGFGEYQPVDTNDTKDGRANNRRVEVLILPNEFKE
ncbi:chemotaxis protein MotB [Bacillus mesophilus]|uniref:Flagellar motor protein MotB n=1 Tax=Bacillus mesophilus TaxID=1808955 RepID=A0A6M0Q5W6_9BACI|nr:flagellar motor protein MotB [Bacillus mesophilus]MBM7659640.1 chemotaxis protein MotB [Bacillus mesophilus]NEY70508.1 flagellar motor protein MotB [Bacillus mesophilus]